MTMTVTNKAKVLRVEADLTTTSEEMAERIAEAVRLLGTVEDKLRCARKIFIKANLVGYMDSARNNRDQWYKGHPIGSTSPMLVEAVLQLVRAWNSEAEVLLGDGLDISGAETLYTVSEKAGFSTFESAYGVELVDCNEGPYTKVEVPDGGLIYRWLFLSEKIADADLIINLPKCKVHTTAGISIAVKNMFGSIPRQFYGGDDRSLMHSNMFKLARILVDVSRTLRPDLTIVDALVASDKYFIGEPVEMKALIVGTEPASVDAACTLLMRFNPQAEFPEVPFTDMENHLALASQAGLGPISPSELELSPGFLDRTWSFSLQPFKYIPPEEIRAWHETILSGAVWYLEHRNELLEAYRDQWLYIIDGEIAWTAHTIKECSMNVRNHHRESRYGFCIQVLPPEEQPERIETYLNLKSQSGLRHAFQS